MRLNIYKDKLLGARLFGVPVLYSAQPIPREDVPQGWYCYDLRGTARHPDEPHSLVDRTEENHTGSIPSYLPPSINRPSGWRWRNKGSPRQNWRRSSGGSHTPMTGRRSLPTRRSTLRLSGRSCHTTRPPASAARR